MNITKKSHHEQQDLCLSRPCYRQGRNLTAVKVYTVSDESTHLLISNVPAIKLSSEICSLCNRFGELVSCNPVPNYDEKGTFVETYHIQYTRIQSARYAKKQIDGRDFFGEVLHACYAPELETVDETRGKLIQRRKEVLARIKKKQEASNDVKTVSLKNSVQLKELTKQSCSTKKTKEDKIKPSQDQDCQPNNDMDISQPVNIPGVFQNKQCTLNSSQPLLIGFSNIENEVSVQNNKTNALSFLPRSLVVKNKQIVFHN